RWVEVHGIVIEVAKVGARRTVDIPPAFSEGFVPAVESLDEVGDCTTEMSEDPTNARESLRDAAEDELCRRQGCVHEETDERHQPILRHRFDADRVHRVDV